MNKWGSYKAKDLVTFKTGKLDSNASEIDGKYPFFTCAQETYRIGNYAFDTECVLLAGNYAAGIFALKYYNGKFNAYQRTYIIEPKDREKLNTRYLYESFKLFLKSFEQTSTGATTKFLTMGILNNLWLSLPPHPIQKKIAAVLSAYDNLIENNNRRIAILEKMAEELYREWFVRLRFPGHEKVKIVKGVPEGWEVKPIGALVEHQIGGGWGQEIPTGSEKVPVYIIRGTDFKSIEKGNFSTAPLRYEKQSSVDTRSLKHGDIILENSVNAQSRCTGNTIIITDQILKQFEHPLIPASFCKLIRFKEPNLAFYIWKLLRCYYNQGSMEYYQNVATNGIANFQMTRFLERFEVNIPNDNNLTTSFWSFDSSKHKSVLQILVHSRDRLLSRLMSGKIDVEKMDIRFPESMLKEVAIGA
mgnify:CR=1 FL=1